MERSEECARPGTTCARVAASPRPGMLRLPSWVDWITSPSGSVILSGCVALRLLRMVTLGRRKCAVAPESAIASSVPRVILIELAWEAQEKVLVDGLDWLVDMVSVLEGRRGQEEQLLVMIVMSSSSVIGGLGVVDEVGVGV